jgi:hypothetical protein
VPAVVDQSGLLRALPLLFPLPLPCEPDGDDASVVFFTWPGAPLPSGPWPGADAAVDGGDEDVPRPGVDVRVVLGVALGVAVGVATGVAAIVGAPGVGPAATGADALAAADAGPVGPADARAVGPLARSLVVRTITSSSESAADSGAAGLGKSRPTPGSDTLGVPGRRARLPASTRKYRTVRTVTIRPAWCTTDARRPVTSTNTGRD